MKKQKTQSTLFGKKHIQECQYLARVKEAIDLVKTHINSPQIWVQSIIGEGDNSNGFGGVISNFFVLPSDHIFDDIACVPNKTEYDWQLKDPKKNANFDLMFVDKVRGDLRLYPSFPDLLLGNASAVLTP